MELFAKSNQETTIELYKKRLIYWGTQNKLEYPNIIDFQMEKFLYGRVNRQFVPMIYNEVNSMISLKQFPTTAGENMQAFSFVVDAFQDMKQQFTKAMLRKKISSTDMHLSDLKIKKAFESPWVRYSRHAEDYMSSFIGRFKGAKIRVRDFEDFVLKFMDEFKKTASTYPLTLSGFMKSRLCPISCTGLALELTNLNPANDIDKMTKFIGSKNYEFFVNACNSYGFMVDSNIPWRIVADIGSAKMVSYAARYQVGSTDTIINSGYQPAHIMYFTETFKFQLFRMYQEIAAPYRESVECRGRTTITEIHPPRFTPRQFLEKYDDNYFLDLYFKIRFLEDENEFKEYEQFLLRDDAIEVYNSYRTQPLKESLDNFERIINKPFDYRGSLSYVSEVVRLNRQNNPLQAPRRQKFTQRITSYMRGSHGAHAHSYKPTRSGNGETSYNNGHKHGIVGGKVLPHCHGSGTSRKCHSHELI